MDFRYNCNVNLLFYSVASISFLCFIRLLEFQDRMRRDNEVVRLFVIFSFNEA